MTIERILVTFPDDTTVETTRPALGNRLVTHAFSIDLDPDGNYVVRDGNTVHVTPDPAEALDTYADYIDTFADDYEHPTARTNARTAATRARNEADTFRRPTPGRTS